MKQFAYHQWTKKDIERNFKVNFMEGLTQSEAGFRLGKFGLNSIGSLHEISAGTIFWRQFQNLFIALLVIAAIISYFVDGIGQAVILLFIAAINIAIGFFQEYKAEKALSALKLTLSYRAKVVRDGEQVEIDARKLVPGDVVILRQGDRIPADIRLIEEEGLRVDEATLTGESMPVSKAEKIYPLETPLAERKNMAYLGTTIYAGLGRGVVVATGISTQFGQIAKMVSEEEGSTPLKKRVAYLSKIFFLIALIISIVVFALGLYRQFETLKLLTFIIALFVGAVPESLPTVITLALAIGVSNMARRQAIVRQMSVIEALGSVNIIATDKTGTLTKNELAVESISFYESLELVTLPTPQGEKSAQLLQFAALASSVKGDLEGDFSGDPLEVAILTSLYHADKKRFTTWREFKLEEELPFDSDKKFMKVMGLLKKDRFLIVKGAVEIVVPFCRLNRYQEIEIHDTLRKLSSKGLKTIAVARKKIDAKSAGDMKEMEFLGILGFSDQPASGVAKDIKSTIKAGIRPIIITGDNAHAAKFIATEIGMEIADSEIISGPEFDELSQEGLKEKIRQIKIFARVTPVQKIEIVRTLEAEGFVVAVTGDGVNDAPALKAATVGIAMGRRGSDVARQSANIVLADDNYSTIVSAIAYGRAIYDNILNALIFLLAGNFDELFLIGIAFILNLPAPLTVVQILWINLVTDALPAVSLAFEKPHRRILEEKPRPSRQADVKPAIIYAGFLGLLALGVSIGLYLWGLHFSVAHARTLVFSAAIIHEMVFAFSIRSKHRFWQSPKEFFRNSYLLASIILGLLLGAAAMLPILQPFFGTTLLSGVEIAILAGTGIFSFVIAEIIRAIMDQKKS